MAGRPALAPLSLPMRPLHLPGDYARIHIVHSFQELLTTPLVQGINALCWPRQLEGDFNEVVEKLGGCEGVLPLDEDLLQALPLSPSGQVAIATMLQDHRLLQEHGLAPELNCIRAYPRDEAPDIVPTDVYSFHADSATTEADTYLCTYHGASSEGLRNDQALRRVDIPEIRADLLQQYGGEDDEDFQAYLSDHCYDLHYAPAPQAQPFSFGLGHLWRVAVDYPDSPVPPCIHRAPDQAPDDPPRLLLIS